MKVRILHVENLRIPEEGSSAQGKSGPKPRPKGVGDGQSVEIPIPPINVIERCGDTGGYLQHTDGRVCSSTEADV